MRNSIEGLSVSKMKSQSLKSIYKTTIDFLYIQARTSNLLN